METLMRNRTVIIGVTAMSVVTVAICLVVFLLSLPGWIILGLELVGPSAKEVATPLTSEVVDDVCVKLEIASDDWRCNHSREVYTVDFFDAIHKKFDPTEKGSYTHDEVRQLIGEYEYSCSDKSQNKDIKYYECLYEFNSDGIFQFRIYYFNVDNSIKRVATFTPD